LAWKPDYGFDPVFGGVPSLLIFLGVYALLVLGTGLWSRQLGRQLATPNFHRSLGRFNRVMSWVRMGVPAWFLIGLVALGWARAVGTALQNSQVDLAQTVIGVALGTLPAFLAWAGLWWSQYPAEVAFREQSVSAYLEGDLPLHKPPALRSYVTSNLRLQLLFMIIPVLAIVLLHDLFRIGATLAVGSRWELNNPDNPVTWLVAAALVFFFAPEILRRVLHTEPLPNSPLRRRLEALCRRTGVRYRDILLWRTQNNVGNAAVMGFVPRMRYILMSDLLVETMSDEEIEAVFAHELGHVVHRHMAWLVVFFIVLTLFIIGCGAWVTRWMIDAGIKDGEAQGIVIATAYLLKFLVLFGFVSRRFERQADVFAARTMELSRASVPNSSASDMLIAARQLSVAMSGVGGTSDLAIRVSPVPENGHVGKYGAAVFGSALQRVAIVNNIPVRARSWCHGSIANRMQYLRELSTDPARTARFDRFMLFLYAALVFGLFAGAAFCWASNAIP
ncbi:MAG TPA: M48 family metallopeptidase, partial [Tepidisphaeraceae bacterium]|nr:M48 family metallopeptidase [Tepidisphaeraceae bacterium]